MSSAYRKPETCWQQRAFLNGGVTYNERGRATTRRAPGIPIVGPLVIVAAIAASVGYRMLATEPQGLQALLLPSANNIAAVLARWDAGSADRFVARMNAAARYIDPSG